MVDTTAERATILGGTAHGTAAVAAKRSTLKPYPENIATGRAHAEAVADALAQSAKEVRSAIHKAAELGDAGTEDLFTGISRDLDKHLWFVEAHLQAK